MFTTRAGFRAVSRATHAPRTIARTPFVSPVRNPAIFSKTLIRNPIQTKSLSFHTSPFSPLISRKSPIDINPKTLITKDQGRKAKLLALVRIPYHTFMMCITAFPFFYLYWSTDYVDGPGRLRFVDISIDMERNLADVEFRLNLQKYQGRILSANDPIQKMVENVAIKLIKGAQGTKDLFAERKIPKIFFFDSILRGLYTHDSLPPPSPGTAVEMSKDRPEVKWQVFVINDETVNSFALPNGRIFVTTGLLKICKDQESVATVIAHEIGHVLGRHSAEARFGLGLVLSLDAALENWFGIRPLLSAWFLKPSMERPNPWHLEEEADKIGLTLMYLANFNPKRAPDIWKKLQEYEKEQNTSKKSSSLEILKMHPLTEKRMQDLLDGYPKKDQIRQIYTSSAISAFESIPSNQISAPPPPPSKPLSPEPPSRIV